MPSDQNVDLDAEDALIEKQLLEAQERITYLKQQVAKERKLRLQIKKKSTTTTTSNEQEQMDAIQSTLEASLLTPNVESAPDLHSDHTMESKRNGQRPQTSNGQSREAGSKQQHMNISQSQPNLGGGKRPQTAGFGNNNKKGRGSGISAVRSKGKRSKSAHSSRPKTAGSQADYLNRLSPQRARPSIKHRDKAREMSYKRLRELMKDKLFQEAVKRKGCNHTLLTPKPVEYFRHQPNRAALVPMEVAQLNFESYETTRVDLLGMVLQEFDVCRDQMRQEEAKVAREQAKLAKVFTKQIGGAEGRMKKITESRHKIENVTIVENKLLKARRRKFEKNANKAGAAQTKYLDKLKADRERREERGRKQQEKIAQVSGMKDQLLQARNAIMEEKFAARDARIKYKRDEKARLAKQKQDLASDGKDDRSQRQKHSKKVRAMKMKRLMERLHEKEQHVKEVQIKKKIEVSALRERKKIQFQKRINNVNRARREQEYRNKVAVKKLEMQWGRMEKMKQIEDAIRVQRELKKKKELIARHKWIADTKLERTITPGPGEYQATNGDMANSHANCAKWGEQNPKSEIEWVMYRAKQLPAPGDYTPYDPNSAVVGGTWGKNKPKSDVEWSILRAKEIPGPGQYTPSSGASANMQAFGNFDPPSSIEILQKRASQLPGPADYSEKLSPLKRPTMRDIKREFQGSVTAVGFMGKLKHSVDKAREDGGAGL